MTRISKRIRKATKKAHKATKKALKAFEKMKNSPQSCQKKKVIKTILKARKARYNLTFKLLDVSDSSLKSVIEDLDPDLNIATVDALCESFGNDAVEQEFYDIIGSA
jgi:hypothetical protein